MPAPTKPIDFPAFLEALQTMAWLINNPRSIEAAAGPLIEAADRATAERELIGKADEITSLHAKAEARELNATQTLENAKLQAASTIEQAEARAKSLMENFIAVSTAKEQAISRQEENLKGQLIRLNIARGERNEFDSATRQLEADKKNLARTQEALNAKVADYDGRLAQFTKLAGSAGGAPPN